MTIVSPGETVTFTTPTTPTTPTKPAKQPAVDVALGGGGALLGIQVGAVLHWLAALGGERRGWHLSNETHLDDGSSERAWKVRLTSVKHGLKRRIARRPARRIAALNHSHLSALSGGLLLLCGGDW